jgi:Icc-related predicted phosphoesterase
LTCFFVSDLHGQQERYQKLYEAVRKEQPEAVFFGGDILPSTLQTLSTSDHTSDGFIEDILVKKLDTLKQDLKQNFPRIFLILGNDDSRADETKILGAEKSGLLEYIHNKKVSFNGYQVFGYAYTPPSPFLLKDWERYDVSRHVDPGAVSPEEGFRTVVIPENEAKYGTISDDLDLLAGEEDFSRAIFLFHAPPYQTKLDRAALDGKRIDHVPLDPHVGSIAIQRFIQSRQPLLTLHGHIHESPRLTHAWKDKIGKTHIFSAAHDGPELALVRFDLENLNQATRELL